MKGYHGKPKETAEAIVENGWLRTGDIAYIEREDGKDGEFFVISDRIKELIKFKGFQVPPAELEAVLLTHPNVNDAVAIGVYSEKDATELPRAYVVPKDLASARKDPAAFERDVQEFVAKHVAPHKRLRGGVRIEEKIEKSPSGKLLRRIYAARAKAESVKPKL